MLIIAEDPGNQIPAEQKHRTKACKGVTAEARYIPFQEKPGHDE